MLIEVRVPFEGSQFQVINCASAIIARASKYFSCGPEGRRVFGPHFQEGNNGRVRAVLYRVSDLDISRDVVWLKKADRRLA